MLSDSCSSRVVAGQTPPSLPSHTNCSQHHVGCGDGKQGLSKSRWPARTSLSLQDTFKSQPGRKVSKGKSGSVGYKARHRADFQCSWGEDPGQGCELKCSSWASRQKVHGRAEQTRLAILQYQSWPSMQAARPLGEREKGLPSPSVRSGPQAAWSPQSWLFSRLSRPSSLSLSLCVLCSRPWPAWWPLLDSLQHVRVSLVSGSPKLHTVLQVWAHKQEEKEMIVPLPAD